MFHQGLCEIRYTSTKACAKLHENGCHPAISQKYARPWFFHMLNPNTCYTDTHSHISNIAVASPTSVSAIFSDSDTMILAGVPHARSRVGAKF